MKRNGAPFLWNGCAVLAEYASVDELEKKAKSGEQISLTDLADAIKAEKTCGKGKEEKPSIRAQLKADKKKAQKKTARQKSQDLERS